MFNEMLDAARAGTPSIIFIEGAAGMGKTTHLRHVLSLAHDFHIISAAGNESEYRAPFSLLRQLGVEQMPDTAPDPVALGRLMQRILDHSDSSPMLFAIDDAHFADPESLESIRWLCERMRSDRFLLAVASRPSAPMAYPGWQRLLVSSPSARLVRLTGIVLDEAADILREQAEDVDDDLVSRLWEHTAGNPLYLRALAIRYPLEELAAMVELPTPIEVARDVRSWLVEVDASASALVEAMAVIGPGWIRTMDAASIAAVTDPATSVDLLLASGLVVKGSGGPLADIRISHALIRSAIYQSIPAKRRRDLHQRAADVLLDPMVRLEHLVVGLEERNEYVAKQLENSAREALAARDFRQSAQLLLWASKTSPSPAEDARRWLDSMLSLVLARDVDAVRPQLGSIQSATDVTRRTLVLAMFYLADSDVPQARRLLRSRRGQQAFTAEQSILTRIAAIDAWVAHLSGDSLESVAALLDSIDEGVADDPVVGSHYVRLAGQIARRRLDRAFLERTITAVPDNARDTALEDTEKLGWRGNMYAMCGLAHSGRRDLSEVVSRIRSGRVTVASGVDHALHGFALWLDGELDRASVEIRAASDVAPGQLHPIASGFRALVPILRGDFETADALLRENERLVQDLPSFDAVAVHMQVQVVRLHAGGDTDARRRYLSDARASLGESAGRFEPGAPTIWQVHMALAHLWAGDADIKPFLRAVESDVVVPEWSRWTTPWLEGLAAEATGDSALALKLLEDSATLHNRELPLYRGHVYADIARLAQTLGDDIASSHAMGQARDLYGRIGATVYLPRIMEVSSETSSAVGGFEGLTEREREIASLVTAGFSYLQIASELYVTRSTVGYHVSNIYAKLGVSNRHALTQFARTKRA